MPHPRDIVAYVLNAKYIITMIFPGHASVYKRDNSSCSLLNNAKMPEIEETFL